MTISEVVERLATEVGYKRHIYVDADNVYVICGKGEDIRAVSRTTRDMANMLGYGIEPISDRVEHKLNLKSVRMR